MPVVRAILVAMALVALGSAVLGFVYGADWPPIYLAILVGVLFLIGALFERAIYKRIAPRAPGPGFVATGERFVDPATRRLVEVHLRPETGERVYVDVGAAPPEAG